MKAERIRKEVIIEVSVDWIEDHFEGFINREDRHYETFFSNITPASLGRLRRLARELQARDLEVHISGDSQDYLGFAIRWCSETTWRV